MKTKAKTYGDNSYIEDIINLGTGKGEFHEKLDKASEIVEKVMVPMVLWRLRWFVALSVFVVGLTAGRFLG